MIPNPAFFFSKEYSSNSLAILPFDSGHKINWGMCLLEDLSLVMSAQRRYQVEGVEPEERCITMETGSRLRIGKGDTETTMYLLDL